jgi:S-formylglutathione hydrolase FrmB
MRFTQMSLLHGWLPLCVTALAFVSLAFGVAWRRRSPWHWLVVGAGATAVAIAIARFVDTLHVGTYPRSFLFWAGLPLFAFGAAVWQWPRVTWWRRAVAFAAVPLLAMFCGLQVNAHYGYLPTLGDLVGAPLPGQVTAQVLERPPLQLGIPNRGHRHRIGFALARAPRRPRTSVTGTSTAGLLGLVAQVDIPAPVSHFAARRGFVWLPPWYFTHPGAQLPVLMLLAGSPGAPADWLRAGGALTTATAYARLHHGYAPIIVLPDANGSFFGDTECVDGPAGRAETYLTVDLPNFMQARFNATADPRRWAVAGLSEGGTCALDLVARHSDLFRTFADFSGDAAPNLGSFHNTVALLYGGSLREFAAHEPARWFGTDASRGVAGYFAVGTGDTSHVNIAEGLAAAARNNRIPTTLDLISGGGHDFSTWDRALTDAFPWIARRLSAYPDTAIRPA